MVAPHAGPIRRGPCSWVKWDSSDRFTIVMSRLYHASVVEAQGYFDETYGDLVPLRRDPYESR